jgi:hypothetical protein
MMITYVAFIVFSMRRYDLHVKMGFRQNKGESPAASGGALIPMIIGRTYGKL